MTSRPSDGRGAGAGSAIVRAPWESRSVRQLQARLGRDDNVQPMMVEGPLGTVLGAVGEQADHRIAGRVLKEVAERRFREKMAKVHGSGLEVRPGDAADVEGQRRRAAAAATGGGAAERERGRAIARRHANEAAAKVVFGAVYEYRDVFGRPKFVGSTSDAPERRFIEDVDAHAGVNELLSRKCGSTAVVWAGCGRGPVGEGEMARIRSEIVEDRSRRMETEKLSSIKPYSRHGW
jgi:hypothetical protein